MKKVFLALAFSWVCSISFAQDRFTNIQVVVEGLNKPYYMLPEDGDLIVSTLGEVVRVHTSQPLIDGNYRVTHVAYVEPGPPSGLGHFGSDYAVVENATGSLFRVTRDGERSLISDELGLPDEFTMHNGDFITVDIATPTDQQVGPAKILRINSAGETTVIADRDLGGPAGILTLGDDFYITDFILGRLIKVNQAGEVTVIAEGLGQPLGIRYDGKAFLIADFADGFGAGADQGRILRVTISGSVEVLAKGPAVGNPSGLTLVGPDLYFSDVVKNRIMKIVGSRVFYLEKPNFKH